MTAALQPSAMKLDCTHKNNAAHVNPTDLVEDATREVVGGG
jgi:hypothetical protein